MQLRNYTHTGSQKIIENLMEFLLVMESYLIMNHQDEVKLLLQEKLQGA